MKKMIVAVLVLSVSAFAQLSKTKVSSFSQPANFNKATQVEINVIRSEAKVNATPSVDFDGFSLAARQNDTMKSDYFDYSSSAIKFNKLDGDKTVAAGVNLEIESLELAYEYRLGLSKKVENVLLRPYIAASAGLQRNKAKTNVPGVDASKTKLDLYPSIGVEANFFNRFGATLSYTQRDTDFGSNIVANNNILALGFNYAL